MRGIRGVVIGMEFLGTHTCTVPNVQDELWLVHASDL